MFRYRSSIVRESTWMKEHNSTTSPDTIHFTRFIWTRSLRIWYIETVENFTIPRYYAASSGYYSPTFRDNLSVPPSRIMNPRSTTRCPETSARNYHHLLRNSRLLCGWIFKSRIEADVCVHTAGSVKGCELVLEHSFGVAALWVCTSRHCVCQMTTVMANSTWISVLDLCSFVQIDYLGMTLWCRNM